MLPNSDNDEGDFEKAPELPTAGLWESERHQHLSEFLAKVMAGEVARGRPLKYWENLKLRPRHLQILLMKAAGYPNNAIAEQMGMDKARVSVIVRHPDAQTILSYLVSYAAEDMLDVKTRIKAHAGEMLDHVLTTVRNSRDEKVVQKGAFKLLEMAGYGAVQKVEAKHTFEIPKAESVRIADTLDELKGLQNIDMERFVTTDHGEKLRELKSGDDEEEQAVA